MGANVGRLSARTWVKASYPEASLMSVGSLKAVPKKLMPERHAQDHPGRHLDDRVAGAAARPEVAEHEVVAVEQVRRPGRVVGGADHRVEVELRQRGVDAVHAGGLVDGQRLVVGHPAEGGLGVVWARERG